jgi:hypothetical protein
MEFLLAATLLSAQPVFVIEKAVEPKVCIIYKDTKYTCSQLMLLYNKHVYRNESKGI